MADEMLRIAGRGEDGTAKALRTNNKGKVIVSKGQKFKLLNKPTLTVTATVQEIYTTLDPCLIDSIVFSTNEPLAYISIGIRDSSGQLQYLPIIRSESFGTSANISFNRIKEDDTLVGGYSDYMELIVYDEVNKRFFMRNRKPIEAPHGCRITVSSSVNCSGSLVAGIMEEI